MSATDELAALKSAGGQPAELARKIENRFPRMAAVKVLQFISLVEETKTSGQILGPCTLHADRARVAMGYVTYGNGTVNVDANGDISSIELRVPFEIEEE